MRAQVPVPASWYGRIAASLFTVYLHHPFTASDLTGLRQLHLMILSDFCSQWSSLRSLYSGCHIQRKRSGKCGGEREGYVSSYPDWMVAQNLGPPADRPGLLLHFLQSIFIILLLHLTLLAYDSCIWWFFQTFVRSGARSDHCTPAVISREKGVESAVERGKDITIYNMWQMDPSLIQLYPCYLQAIPPPKTPCVPCLIWDILKSILIKDVEEAHLGGLVTRVLCDRHGLKPWRWSHGNVTWLNFERNFHSRSRPGHHQWHATATKIRILTMGEVNYFVESFDLLRSFFFGGVDAPTAVSHHLIHPVHLLQVKRRRRVVE